LPRTIIRGFPETGAVSLAIMLAYCRFRRTISKTSRHRFPAPTKIPSWPEILTTSNYDIIAQALSTVLYMSWICLRTKGSENVAWT
jgi:hypothetical protein